MREITDTWENMKLTVVKYYKGTQERGYILGSVDEITQCLDDNTVNLQSISGSRFVGPFLQTVHKWEKTLSLIGEVIEVRGDKREMAAGQLQRGRSVAQRPGGCSTAVSLGWLKCLTLV